MPAVFHDFPIPMTSDQAVSRSWPAVTGGRPRGVTWHWTATTDLETCRAVLGGTNPQRKGEASAHYGVGRKDSEGIDRYVSLNDRSWHAGKNQLCQCDGTPFTRGMEQDQKASRTTIGVETVNIGFERSGVPAEPDWLRVARTNSRQILRVQPWRDEQIELMIEVGKEIQERWPEIRPRDHHGHHDLCPDYKDDVIGFPFAAVLRGIYEDPGIPDVWSLVWMPAQRQRVLGALGHDLGAAGVDGDWGGRSDTALRAFQQSSGLAVTGRWSTWVGWKAHDALRALGKTLEAVAGTPEP